MLPANKPASDAGPIHQAGVREDFMTPASTMRAAVTAGRRSFNPDVKSKPGRTPLSQIKLLPSDPVAQEAATEEIKKKYAQYFGI